MIDDIDIVQAIIDYLREMQKGFHEYDAEALQSVIDAALECKFEDRHLPINRVIIAAIHRQEEKNASSTR